MEKIAIKQVGRDDIAALQKIGRETFFETFSESNSAQDMAHYLAEGFSEGKLAQELNTEGAAFYFALLDDEVIGYLKVNTGSAQTEPQNNSTLEIERIYVLRTYHGKRVGQLLYDKAVQIAESLQVDDIWLGVWEKKPAGNSIL